MSNEIIKKSLEKSKSYLIDKSSKINLSKIQ